MVSVIKRLPWHYIIILLIACVILPYYISYNYHQQAIANANAKTSVTQAAPLGAQTLSRLNGLNSTGPKTYDTGNYAEVVKK